MDLPVITKASKSTKKYKLGVIKYFLIEHMEELGYDTDDEGSEIVFSNPETKLSIWFRPSRPESVLVTNESDKPFRNKLASKLEAELDSLLEAAIVSVNL